MALRTLFGGINDVGFYPVFGSVISNIDEAAESFSGTIVFSCHGI